MPLSPVFGKAAARAKKSTRKIWTALAPLACHIEFGGGDNGYRKNIDSGRACIEQGSGARICGCPCRDDIVDENDPLAAKELSLDARHGKGVSHIRFPVFLGQAYLGGCPPYAFERRHLGVNARRMTQPRSKNRRLIEPPLKESQAMQWDRDEEIRLAKKGAAGFLH